MIVSKKYIQKVKGMILGNDHTKRLTAIEKTLQAEYDGKKFTTPVRCQYAKDGTLAFESKLLSVNSLTRHSHLQISGSIDKKKLSLKIYDNGQEFTSPLLNFWIRVNDQISGQGRLFQKGTDYNRNIVFTLS